MFRNRNSQKPPEEMYQNFKTSFANFHPALVADIIHSPKASFANATGDGLDFSSLERQSGEEDTKDFAFTPLVFNMDWKPSPSFHDTGSNSMATFSNDWSGYYPPTPGGIFATHTQAGDLHVSHLLGLGTPLSRPASQPLTSMVHNASLTMQDFHLQHMAPPMSFTNQPMYHPSPSHLQKPTDQFQTGNRQGSAAHHRHVSESSLMASHAAVANKSPPARTGQSIRTPSDGFRFGVTLNAPTAMIRKAGEIPITYLNKCQTYTISIVDNVAGRVQSVGTRYRTFIRISFEDEQQRARPAACWQLWKEGRGSNEAHQRGGRLQAVEYVETQSCADDQSSNVELVQAAFDGFSVVWYPNQNGAAECSVSVRFNFLSTDFSHSKGVKGIPVRLCAKTQILDASDVTAAATQEVAYCKVKLFRDHGAERKLANDISHVKKSIEKLNQQIAQGDSPAKEGGKRKRSGSPSRSNKKRAWSVSSCDSGREPTDDDFQAKLAVYEAMFTSTNPSSVLFLRGDEQDDPEYYPVALAGQGPDMMKTDAPSRKRSLQKTSTGNMSNTAQTSPSQSPISLDSPQQLHHISRARGQGLAGECEAQRPQLRRAGQVQDSSPRQRRSPGIGSNRASDQRMCSGSQETSAWMESLDVDPNYSAPEDALEKPVACFYIKFDNQSPTGEGSYYRAVYLQQRSLEHLVAAIAAKAKLGDMNVTKVLRVCQNGLQIKVDGQVVEQMPEAQDMTAEFVRTWPSKAEENSLGVSQFLASPRDGEQGSYTLILRY